MTSIWGAVFAKAGSAYNPIVYGISHPKYRAALHDKFPCLKCGSDSSKGGDSASTVAEGDKGGEWSVKKWSKEKILKENTLEN